MRTGVEAFLEGLRELGYTPEILPGKPDHVVINYEVEGGKFAGTETAAWSSSRCQPTSP